MLRKIRFWGKPESGRAFCFNWGLRWGWVMGDGYSLAAQMVWMILVGRGCVRWFVMVDLLWENVEGVLWGIQEDRFLENRTEE